MSFNFRHKLRRQDHCGHDALMRIEVAGMSREVCESCGKVRIGYVENHATNKVLQLATTASPDRDPSPADAD